MGHSESSSIPIHLFIKYSTVLKDKTPFILKRFLRAFGIDYTKTKNSNNNDKNSRFNGKFELPLY